MLGAQGAWRVIMPATFQVGRSLVEEVLELPLSARRAELAAKCGRAGFAVLKRPGTCAPA